MLKALFTALTGNLFRKKYNPGYQTRIYPRLGEPIIIHDTLDFGPIASFQKIEEINDIWQNDDNYDTDETLISQTENWLAHVSESNLSNDFNPATGFPMLDCCIDVAGNMYGTSDFDTEIDSSFDSDIFSDSI